MYSTDENAGHYPEEFVQSKLIKWDERKKPNKQTEGWKTFKAKQVSKRRAARKRKNKH